MVAAGSTGIANCVFMVMLRLIGKRYKRPWSSVIRYTGTQHRGKLYTSTTVTANDEEIEEKEEMVENSKSTGTAVGEGEDDESNECEADSVEGDDPDNLVTILTWQDVLRRYILQ
uniref:Uncharacterized protein n=1 Tax=Lygus hesperus TaxID=30085 RepID=A0A146KY04_LYGHE